MKNLTIAHRIILMIVSVLSLLLVGVVGLFVAQRGSDSIKTISEGAMPRIQTLGEARQIFMEARVNMYAIFLNTDGWRWMRWNSALADTSARSI